MNTTSDHTPAPTNDLPKRTRRRKLTAQKAYAAAEKQLLIAQAAKQKAFDQIEAAKREELARQGERLVTAVIRLLDRSTREAVMAMILDGAMVDQRPRLHAWQATLG